MVIADSLTDVCVHDSVCAQSVDQYAYVIYTQVCIYIYAWGHSSSNTSGPHLFPYIIIIEGQEGPVQHHERWPRVS